MGETNIKRLKEMTREELISLAIELWDENQMYRDKEIDSMFELKTIVKNSEYKAHLEKENERLNTAIHNIYQDIKMKCLKFILNAKLERGEIDILNNLFKNYLK